MRNRLQTWLGLHRMVRSMGGRGYASRRSGRGERVTRAAASEAGVQAHLAGAPATSAMQVGRKAHAKRKMSSKEKDRKGKIGKKSKEWILLKKEAMRKDGREVRHDSKYTGRKRPNNIRF